MMSRIRDYLDVVSSVFVIAAATILLFRMYGSAGEAKERPGVEEMTGTIALHDVSRLRGVGKIALVEFSDFECPFCASHARQTFPLIEKHLIDPGHIRYVVFNFPLSKHLHAQKASEAAECAGRQGRFWEMRERLFEDQKSLGLAGLVASADRIGIDRGQFEDCVERGETAQEVSRDVEEGLRLGVTGTPAFFVGVVDESGRIDLKARLQGALPFEEFKKAVQMMRQ